MYCPRCSQQQASEEVRFCSRCGLPLSAVRELVVGGGELVEREAEAQAGRPMRALKGMRKGVWWMLASLLLALVAGILTALDDDLAVFVLLPVLCFFVGFARLLYGTFLEGRVKKDASQAHVAAATRRPELAPPTGTPVEAFAAQRRTAEMAQPPSVTESTTRLLDGEDGTHRA
ncbi:MAG TPA: hypothetical protein VER08_04780 [Pyrinomonadaceae bacterium]|nr:hypothetical protein [Pyrinomonadaceae bacterium]